MNHSHQPLSSPSGPLHDAGTEAEALLAAERYGPARRRFLAVPTPDARTYSGMAAAYAGLAEFDKAEAAVGEALARDPREARALAVAGYLADVVERDPRRAVELLREAITADPRSAYAHYSLGALLLKYEAYDEARAALLATQALDPHHWRAALALSRFAPAPRERSRQARAAYQEGLRQNPGDPRLRLALLRTTVASPLSAALGASAPPSSEVVRRQHTALQALFTRTSRPYLTYTILAVNTIMLAVLETHGFSAPFGVLESATSDVSGLLIDYGAKYNPRIAQGDWWRLLTPMVLHAGLLHWGMNSLFLWTMGPMVERLFGRVRMLFMYVFTGVCGNLASYMFTVAAPSVGASTALAGLLGALAVFYGRERGLLGSFGQRQFYAILITAGLNLAFGLAVPQIDNAGHAGGFLSGLLVGFLLMPRYRLQEERGSATGDRDARGHSVPIVRDRRSPAGLFGQGALLTLLVICVTYITIYK